MILPRGFEKWNRALRGAYLKGAKAAENGESIFKCPYKDKRKKTGSLTWSRAFICAWRDGWNDYKSQQDPITQFWGDRQR